MCNEVGDVFIDGTFKCCAKFFLQMYNIMDYAMDLMFL